MNKPIAPKKPSQFNKINLDYDYDEAYDGEPYESEFGFDFGVNVLKRGEFSLSELLKFVQEKFPEANYDSIILSNVDSNDRYGEGSGIVFFEYLQKKSEEQYQKELSDYNDQMNQYKLDVIAYNKLTEAEAVLKKEAQIASLKKQLDLLSKK